MKKEITTTQTICDFCQANGSYDPCGRCGKDACWECKKIHGVSYNHDVFMQGSGDGFYCTPCDIDLLNSGQDPIHTAYLKIARLRSEYKLFSDDFDAKRKATTEELKRLQALNK